MSNRSSRSQRGFTLIELVVVIVLLGILAAFALPRFVNLTNQAFNSVNRGLGGSVSSATALANTAWQAGGSPATITLQNGTVVHMNAAGWPDAIGAAAGGTAADCAALWNGILKTQTPAAAGSSCATTNCYNATATASACTYTMGGTPAGGPYTVVYSLTTGDVTISP